MKPCSEFQVPPNTELAILKSLPPPHMTGGIWWLLSLVYSSHWLFHMLQSEKSTLWLALFSLLKETWDLSKAFMHYQQSTTKLLQGWLKKTSPWQAEDSSWLWRALQFSLQWPVPYGPEVTTWNPVKYSVFNVYKCPAARIIPVGLVEGEANQVLENSASYLCSAHCIK